MMNLTIDAGLAALLGTALGLLGSSVTHWLQGRREEKLWRMNQQAEREKWARDRLHEAYAHALHHLNLIISKHSTPHVDWAEEYIDALKWLSLVLLYSPTLGQGEEAVFEEIFNDFSSSYGLSLPDLELVLLMRNATLHIGIRDNTAPPGGYRGAAQTNTATMRDLPRRFLPRRGNPTPPPSQP